MPPCGDGDSRREDDGGRAHEEAGERHDEEDGGDPYSDFEMIIE